MAVSSTSPWRNAFGKRILHFRGSRIERVQKRGKKAHTHKKKLFFAQMYLLSASVLKHSPTYSCTSSMPIKKKKKKFQHILGFMRPCDNWILWNKAAGMHFHAFPCICSYRSFKMSRTEKWTFCFVLSKVSRRLESFRNELKPLKSQTHAY